MYLRCSQPKKTPIQKTLPVFPEAENESMSIIDVSFNYPATPPQMIQIARLLGMDPNAIRIQQSTYADSIDAEREGYEEQPNPVIGSEEGEQPESKVSKEASEYYGGRSLQKRSSR